MESWAAVTAFTAVFFFTNDETNSKVSLTVVWKFKVIIPQVDHVQLMGDKKDNFGRNKVERRKEGEKGKASGSKKVIGAAGRVRKGRAGPRSRLQERIIEHHQRLNNQHHTIGRDKYTQQLAPRDFKNSISRIAQGNIYLPPRLFLS